MFEKWLKKLEKVLRAQTREEREAIYRFRYAVYVRELARQIGGVDLKNQMVNDEDDEQDFTIHLYAGTKENILGCVRLCVWEAGQIPAAHFQKLSLDLFPGIERLAIAELGRLMIKPTMRGRLILPALMRAGYELLVKEKNVRLSFCYCRPGLVRYYKKLGARPYPGRLIEDAEGMEVPMVSVLSDLDYYKKVGSPLTSLVKQHFESGELIPLDPSILGDVFQYTASMVETDAAKIWEMLQHDFLEVHHRVPAVMEALSQKAIRDLSSKGFIMDVPAGTLVTREGHVEKELYIILAGTFEAFLKKRRLEVMGEGDLFGEVAFFRESGKRSASVRALTDGRLLCLRRKFLQELVKEHPDTAFTILFNLGRLLSERLVSVDKLLVHE